MSDFFRFLMNFKHQVLAARICLSPVGMYGSTAFPRHDGDVLPSLPLDTRKQVDDRQHQVDRQSGAFFLLQFHQISGRPLIPRIKLETFMHPRKLIPQAFVGMLPEIPNHSQFCRFSHNQSSVVSFQP